MSMAGDPNQRSGDAPSPEEFQDIFGDKESEALAAARLHEEPVEVETTEVEAPAERRRKKQKPARPRSGRTVDWLVPCAVAFVASACVMTLEIAAGRIIARHVGQSLYTWTAVIGVVLGGITIGNYAGGWVADFFRPRHALSALFAAAGLATFVIPFLNDWVGGWDWTVGDGVDGDGAEIAGTAIGWRVRVFVHVTAVFVLPSTFLGLIGPVVAKMALDAGRATGRTVGSVYAWGAFGSIVGTYLTGFFLIDAFGTFAVVLCVGGVLLLTGAVFAPHVSLALLGPPLIALGVVAPFEPGSRVRAAVGLPAASPLSLIRQESGWRVVEDEDTAHNGHNSTILHVDESRYSFIKVELDAETSDDGSPQEIRKLYLDSLLHSGIDLENIEHLYYDYEEIYRAVVHRALDGLTRPIKAQFIGGGGFVFPRFLMKVYPGSLMDVAEIDPEVTRANYIAFGLDPAVAQVVDRPLATTMDPPAFRIRNLDARNHIDDLLRLKRGGAEVSFDFVFGDAFNHFTVPYHLTTVEFTRKIKDILDPERGVYLINIIDIFELGRFLGAIVNTFEQVFEHVYVLCTTENGPDTRDGGRDTFVVVGASRPLRIEDLPAAEGPLHFEGSVLTPDDLAALRKKSRGLVLTDDHAPVEQLLAEVFNRR